MAPVVVVGASAGPPPPVSDVARRLNRRLALRRLFMQLQVQPGSAEPVPRAAYVAALRGSVVVMSFLGHSSVLATLEVGGVGMLLCRCCCGWEWGMGVGMGVGDSLG